MDKYLEEINEILEKHGVDGMDTIIMELTNITETWYPMLKKYAQWDEGFPKSCWNNEIIHFKEVFDRYNGCLMDIAHKLDNDLLIAGICPNTDKFRKNE